MNKKQYKEFGKQGAEKRWQPERERRHEMIVELSKFVDKDDLDWIQKWPTTHIQKLFEAYKNDK